MMVIRSTDGFGNKESGFDVILGFEASF